MKEQTKKTSEEHGAHAGVRNGGSDYNDGANVTDQLGNDEQNQNFGTFDSGLPAKDEKKNPKKKELQ